MKSKMINIKDFDFQDLLDSASNLYDVEFKIIDENSQELGTVRSHKFLLSLLSPVLKKMFSSREEGSIVVEITGPSFISFQALIQFLYTGDESVITDISSIDDLFDLYYLGDKYELRGARNLIKEVVSSFKINQENWIHVLKEIKKYENTFLFEDLCNILQDQVQGYLKGCPSSDEYLDDIQESDDTDFYSWVKNWIQKWRRSDTGLQEADRKYPQESELKDLKIQIQNMKYQHEELIQTTQQKDKRIEELELKHEELIQTTEQKDKRIEELELKHEELIQTTQQKDKRIEELELNQNDLQHDLQTKDRKIQNLESQHEEFIKNTEQKLRMMKEMKGKADFKVVNPVCPGECGRNIPLKNMFEHFRDSCDSFCKYYIKFSDTCLMLNTEVKIVDKFAVHKLEESRDWFIMKIQYINNKYVFYIMHHSEEETKDVFYYSLKYSDGNILKSVTLRCAPMGISPKDAVHNNFTTNWRYTNVKFTMYKA